MGKCERDRMIGAIVRLIGGVPDGQLGVTHTVVERLAGGSGSRWAEHINRALQEPLDDLLEFVAPVPILALPEFDARNHFKVDTTGEVKIGYIDSSFMKLIEDRVEPAIAETTLRVHKLRKDSTDKQIIAELGGEDVAETGLAQMYELMEAQGRGQQGILPTNGYTSAFYVRSADGILWAASCFWYPVCKFWGVSAYPVTPPCGLNAGCRVFSR